MTTMIETFGTIRADGTLEVEGKLAVPPGRVKVRVESIEEETDAETLLKNGWRSEKLDVPFECGGEQVQELWYHPIHSRGFSLSQAVKQIRARERGAKRAI